MNINHFNHNFSDGIPLSVGDRYYGQDRARDFWSQVERAGRALYDFYGKSNVLINGGVVSEGSSKSKINITAITALCPYSVTIPNSFSALPPTYTTAIIPAIITDSPSQVDFDLSVSGSTLDGTTVNYLKIAYSEIDGPIRNYAKKSGSYAYEVIPSYVLSCDSTPPTSFEVEIAQIIGNGTSILTISRQVFAKNEQSLRYSICPVGTYRSEPALVSPREDYPWLCLTNFDTYIDISETNWPDLVQYIRNIKVILNDGISGELDSPVVSSWAISSNVATLTFQNDTPHIAFLTAMVEDESVNGGYSNWRTITLPSSVGSITAGTYAITGINPSIRTLTFNFTSANNSGSGTYLSEFYAHRIAGSSTTARVFSARGLTIHGPNDGNYYFLSGGLRRRGYMQGHWTKLEDSDPTYTNSDGSVKTNTASGAVVGLFRNSGTTEKSLFAKSPISDGVHGTPRTGSETHGPAITAHLYIHGGRYNA